MIKKLGAVVAATAAGLVMMGGMASATTGDCDNGCPTGNEGVGGGIVGNEGSVDHGELNQVGLVNLNNTDVLHNVNAVLGVCDNNINVLGVQVPVEDVANGLNVPLLSPGENEAEGNVADVCASGGIIDGGTGQSN